MLNSKKIKYLTVIGTFSIISTAYLLHASSYYEKRHPLEGIKQDTNHKLTELKPKEDTLLVEKIEVETQIQPEDEPVTPKIVKPLKKVAEKDKHLNLTKFLSENRYLEIDTTGKLEPHAKDVLEKLLPMLASSIDDDQYIELEGHSATKSYQYQTKQASEQAALLVQAYLNSKLKDKKIVVTSYGDLYPIVDNKKDERNSRVELKIRRR